MTLTVSLRTAVQSNANKLKECGVTKTKLAEECQLSPGTISRYFALEKVSIETHEKITDYLNKVRTSFLNQGNENQS